MKRVEELTRIQRSAVKGRGSSPVSALHLLSGKAPSPFYYRNQNPSTSWGPHLSI